jgi:uncharacterized protein (UPF0335 family)
MAKKPKKQDADIDNDPQFQTTREASNSVLRMNLERAIRLEDEIKAIRDDIKDIFQELKSSGYDGKTSRRMKTLLRMQPDARAEMLMLEETYQAEMGF